jgi:hypothetical protein
MLKQLNKENLLKNNSVDVNKYNSDYVYKIIKKNKLPYNNLNKESIMALIVNHDKNLKNGKLDSHFLKTKTSRKKIMKNVKIGKETMKVGENMYEEKVIKRRNKNEANSEITENIIASKRGSFREMTKLSNQNALRRRIVDKIGSGNRGKFAAYQENNHAINENKVHLCKIYTFIILIFSEIKATIKKISFKRRFRLRG